MARKPRNTTKLADGEAKVSAGWRRPGFGTAAVLVAAAVALAARWFAGGPLEDGARARTETYNGASGAHLQPAEAAQLAGVGGARLSRLVEVNDSSSPYAPGDPSAPPLRDQLVAPFTFDAFLAAHLAASPEPRALHISRGGAHKHFARLLGIDVVDRVITHGASTRAAERRPPRNHVDVSLLTRVWHQGELRTGKYGAADAALSVEEVRAKFEAGFTILINDVDQRDTRTAALCESLEQKLGLPVNANVYVTHRGTQGFEAHFDAMDVLVVQLEGEKDWLLYEPFLPLADNERKFAPPGALLASVPTARVTLRPGDVLFLPRGMPHEAATAQGSALSMHVTLGVLGKGATWAELVHAAIDECAAAGGGAGASKGGGAGCPAAAKAQVAGSDARTGLRWAELLHAAVRALTWSGEDVALELRAGLPLHERGWGRADATAARLASLLRSLGRGGRAEDGRGGIELSSSAFAWSDAAASSENGRADPRILRPKAGRGWRAATETTAGWRELDAGIRARLGVLGAESGALARLASSAIQRVSAQRVDVRQSARRRDLERHGQPALS